MARWQVTIQGKGVRKAGVEKLAERLKGEYGDGVSVTVSDATPPESRPERFSAAQSLISDAKAEMEALKDELQDWLDNTPDNLRNGDKASQLEEAISSLEDIASALEDQEGHDVDFPSMM